MKPTLVILAAGMGSRYGGLKQIDPIGPNGEAILEYSVFDAIQAGFGKVVFVIRKNFEAAFIEKFGDKFAGRIEVAYAFQEVNAPIAGLPNLPEREKPWGTAHAVLVAQDVVNEPFAVINADDYYGAAAYQQIAHFLTTTCSPTLYGMVGYQLANTMSENGGVNRGVCQINALGYLTDVVERLKIQRNEDGRAFFPDSDETEQLLDDEVVVSMNFWGFHPHIFAHLNEQFLEYARLHYHNPKSEFYIPLVVNNLIKSGDILLKVMTSPDQWYGVTYKEDRDTVVAAFKDLTSKGVYPKTLWES